MRLKAKLCTVSGVGAVVLGAMLAGSAAQPAPTGVRRLARHHGTARIHRQRDDGTYESTNWAGYAVTGAKGAVTDVKASWQVPPAQCSTTYANGYSSFWVGIDGWTSNTVEQIGTDSDCVSLNGKNDTPTYYAWFEFYPKGAYLIEFPRAISPGDIISAEVKATGGTATGPRGGNEGSKFTATLTDLTTGYTFSTSASVAGAQESSAEWIAEAPCCSDKQGDVLPLAPFGTVDFGSDFTTVNSKTGALGSFGANVQQSIMVDESNSTIVKAQPSAVSDGTSFSVQWFSPGP
jgi:hypothetical protein